MFNVIGYVVAALIGAAVSWGVQDWRYGDEIQTIRLNWQKQRTEDMNDLINKERKARDERDTLQRKIVENEQRYLDQLRLQDNETQKLRDCVASGKCGLRVAATCPKPKPATGNAVPTPADAVSVGNDSAARLTAAAESTYYALRSGLTETQLKLQKCQSDLATVTGYTAAPAP